jgi:uncharacterized protein YaiE (UPF0345 family)
VRTVITVNEYLGGKVKSLGFERDGTLFTAGVLSAGDYSFDTEKEEHITVTVGDFEIRPQGAEWRAVKTGDTAIIPANSTFDLKVGKPAAYVCMYK